MGIRFLQAILMPLLSSQTRFRVRFSLSAILSSVCLFLSVQAFGQREQIDSLNNLSFDIKIANAYTLDEKYLKNAEVARQIGYPIGEADSYVNLGLMYYYQGKYSLNLKYFLKAIEIYEREGDIEKQAGAYGEVGYMMKRRNLLKAMQYMQKGKRLAEQHNIEKPLLPIYDNYGVLHEMKGDLDSALYFYRKSLMMKEKFREEVGIPYSLNNIAGILVMKKRFADAKPIYDRALAMRMKLNDQIGIAENYGYLGDFYREQGLWDEALRQYQKSLEQSEKFGYTYLIQINHKNMAKVYQETGRFKDALMHHKKYVQFKDSLLNKETNARIAELEVQFETSKKEKMLLEKDAEVRSRNMVVMILTLVSIAAGLIGFLIYRQQKLTHRQMKQEHELKSAIARIEMQNQLQEQRLQISRDLHDNIGSQLTFIISSIDNLRYAFDFGAGKLGEKLSNISNFARDTIVELRDTIWAMNTSEIGFDDLRARISNFIEKAREASSNINFNFTVDESLSPIRFSSVAGINIHRTIQEAVNNALKYSGATEISIFIRPQDGGMMIIIDDNGKGFDPKMVERGHGLSNMEQRIHALGGKLSIESVVGAGTRVKVFLPKTESKSVL